MSIKLKRETERLLQEEIQRGRFESLDDLIVDIVLEWRKKLHIPEASPVTRDKAVERALHSARTRAIPLEGISIKELLHEGHRL